MKEQMPEFLHPQRLYSAEVVSYYADLHRESVYLIPEEILPRQRVGPRRGLVRYLGADILRYLGADVEEAA